MTSTEKKRRW